MSTAAFALYFAKYRMFKSIKVFWGAIAALTAFLIIGLLDPNMKLVIAKPDNIPIVMMLFLVLFFTWLPMSQAAINDERIEKGLAPVEAEDSSKKIFVWPDLVYSEFICGIIVMAFLTFWAICFEAPLEEFASTTNAPNPAKAPWYFLGLQEMLVYYDPWLAGVVLPGLIIVGLIAIPYIDINPRGNGYYTFKERKFAVLTFQFGWLILWVLLIILGTFLRGPNWNFFGPFEYWDLHKLEALVNVNLSEYFWMKWLNMPMPTNILVREAPGFIVVAAYFSVVPMALTRGVRMLRELSEKLGPARYAILMMSFLMMASLPIKMLLRWTLNLKYIVGIPEYFFNI